MRYLVAIIALIVGLAGSLQPLAAAPMETSTKVALLIDIGTGVALLQKQPEQTFEPASMVKMMTIAVVLDAIRKGEITAETEYAVSEAAWRKGGAPSGTATMFAALKSRIRVADLMRGVMVQAANDACLVLAEGLTGDETKFASRMNALAVEIGLKNSAFVNATGLPEPGQKTNARDLVRLAEYLRLTYPESFRIYGERDFTWNKVFQRNRNPLVGHAAGVDGIVAGASAADGFGLVATAEQDGRRLLLVLSGVATAAERLAEAKRLIEWGFASFKPRKIFDKGTVVGEIQVYGGERWSVPVETATDVQALLRTDSPDTLTAEIAYTGPVPAPIAAGATIGVLRLKRDGITAYEVPVQAVNAVGVGSLTTRALGAVVEVFAGLWHKGKQAL